MNQSIMTPITAADPISHSEDIVADNVAKLQALFPETFSEGKINFDTLRQLLGGEVDDSPEKYGLNWHGKRAARQLALTPSTGTLRPDKASSVDWDTTQNLMIEGDNLEVLKLLQRSYSKRVKLIYIDPPYNTGKDFVYPDDWRDSINNYQKITGQLDGEGRKNGSNPEGSGRFHTDWLNMMYPRLKVARDFLAHDGLILVSIDEHEISNIRFLLNEFFGEENLVGTIVWKGATDNNPTQIAIEHEYIACFGRTKDAISSAWKNFTDDAKLILLNEYDRIKDNKLLDLDSIQKSIRRFIKDNKESLAAVTHYDRVDENGVYTGSRKVHNPKPGGYFYDVPFKGTDKVCTPPVNGYRYPEESMAELIANDKILFGDDENQIIQIKEYLRDYEGKLSSVIHLDSRAGANELNSLFDVQKLFTNPKPLLLLKDIFEFLVQPNDCVMDFFAGSGTTAHATWRLNAQDNGNRTFILVQLPEPLDPEEAEQKTAAEYCDKLHKPRNIAELTKERLRRAGTKVKADNPMFAGDTGFRVFKLDSSNIRAWEPDTKDVAGALELFEEHIKPDRTDDDVLYELLLKLGLDLCVPMQEREIAGKVVHAIGGGTLVACLDESVEQTDAEPLALGIAAWLKELEPAGDITCVFRDSAFQGDVAKTNCAMILQQHGVKFVRSL